MPSDFQATKSFEGECTLLLFFFYETVMSAAKNLFPSSVHLILLTRRQKKGISPVRIYI